MTAVFQAATSLKPAVKNGDRSHLIALGTVLIVLVLQLQIALSRAINWDEFWHYSLTVLAMKGELDQPLQTFFTRAFMWVSALPGNAVDH